MREVLKARQTSLGPITVVINGVGGLSFDGSGLDALSEDWLQTSAMVFSSEIKPQEVELPTRLLNLTSTILDFAEVETFDPSREINEYS